MKYVFTAGLEDLERFEWMHPDNVQRVLAGEGFVFPDHVVMDSFLLCRLGDKQQIRTSIFSVGMRVGEMGDGTTQTLAEVIARYIPGPGLFFYPPYVALTQEKLYSQVEDEFKKQGWITERVSKR